MPNPRYPLYIPSKGRPRLATTPRVLYRMGVPFRLVIEEQEWDDYATYFPDDVLLVLDPAYKAAYDPLMDLKPGQSTGAGPARNFIWDHSIAEGYDWHWIMDDNITSFWRIHGNQKIPCADGTPFAAMEQFATRYRNVAMAGPHYFMFAPAREKHPPYVVGTRVYSCNLIRNAVEYRWRGRYNEDTILSLDLLKAGWQTIQFFAFLQGKLTSQQFGGGNTEAFYAAEGTLPKSKMLVATHPDVSTLSFKWGRWHHHVDYSQWRTRPLLPDPDWTPSGDRFGLRRQKAARSYWIPGSFVKDDAIIGSPWGNLRALAEADDGA